MKLYQAAIGPSQTNLHIYEVEPSRLDYQTIKLSLCQSVNCVRNYKGPVSQSNSKLCRRCFTVLKKTLPDGEGITAEMIGVQTIED
jgi:hypothetical protein